MPGGRSSERDVKDAMKEKKKLYVLCCCAGIVCLLFIDQYTKHLAAAHLRGAEDVIWIPGVFQLHYLENRGAAFGLFQDRKIFFLILCALFLAAAVWFLGRIPAVPRYIPLYAVTAGLAAGAAGNGIDRLFHGYVTDLFYFSLIDFPVFNMADIYVVVSGFFLVIYICFVYREEELAFMQKKRG